MHHIVDLEAKVVAIDIVDLPIIANTFFHRLGINVTCFYSVAGFNLHRREDAPIDILMLDASPMYVELLQRLRKASKNFPVIIHTKDTLELECVRAQVVDLPCVWLYKREDDNFSSLIQTVVDILMHTVRQP